MQQTWYLASDMQLFVLSLLIVVAMWKYQQHVKTILAVCLILSILLLGGINYIYDFDIVTRSYPE